jgi:phosphopantetheinyl transferase
MKVRKTEKLPIFFLLAERTQLQIPEKFAAESPLCEDLRNRSCSADAYAQSLSVRYLLSILLEKFTVAEQNFVFPDGKKPKFATDDLSFSFSHSKNFSMAALSFEKKIGTDIELLSPKILQVLPRIASENELDFVGDDLPKAGLIWTLKEAAYKCSEEKNVFWREEIEVIPESEKIHLRNKQMRFHSEIFFKNLCTSFCAEE